MLEWSPHDMIPPLRPRRALFLALAVLILGTAFLMPRSRAQSALSDSEMMVRLTVYLDRGVMYSGLWTHWTAAACSWNFPLYTVLELPDGHQVTCLDRGRLGSSGWVDLWAPDWATGAWLQRYYGEWTSVAIVRWGGE